MLLGARQFFERRGGGGWQNPYVTDGLIAMWDGEWNAGGGVHDATATTWVDLSGNSRDAVLSGTYSWGANYWHVESKSNRGLATWPAQNLGSDQTVEFVCKVIDGVHYGRYISEPSGVAAPCFFSTVQGAGTLYMYGYGADRSLVQAYNPFSETLHQITHKSGSTLDYYINGTLSVHNTSTFHQDSTGATNGYFANNPGLSRGIDANYFCIRRYNRVLTSEELAANYAVDAQRFGIGGN